MKKKKELSKETKNIKLWNTFTGNSIQMDVGRERSTLGEYLHSLTVSLIFNLAFHGVAHNTNAVWGMEVSCNNSLTLHFHHPNAIGSRL